MTDNRIGGVEFHARRVWLGWSVEQAAIKIGVTRRTIARWEQNTLPVPDVASHWLTEQETKADVWAMVLIDRNRTDPNIPIRLDRYDRRGHLPSRVQAALVGLAINRGVTGLDIAWRA